MSEATPPSAKRRRLDLSDSFKLLIGHEKREVIIHKEYLTKTADFFKAYDHGHDWKENHSKTIELPEDSWDTVQIYLQWLYQGEVVASDIPFDTFPQMTPENERARVIASSTQYQPLLKAAVLADKFGDAAFSNAIVDAILVVKDATYFVPDTNAFSWAYDPLPLSSPTKVLLQDLYLGIDTDCFARDVPYLPADSVQNLASRMHEAQGKPRVAIPTFQNRCKYHIHNDSLPKCK